MNNQIIRSEVTVKLANAFQFVLPTFCVSLFEQIAIHVVISVWFINHFCTQVSEHITVPHCLRYKYYSQFFACLFFRTWKLALKP